MVIRGDQEFKEQTVKRGDQEFKEQTVKIVWKEVSQNFSGDGHVGA